MPSSSPVLSILGAARTVTGSKFLLETSDRAVLVDCGLFQGLKELRLQNWERPGLDVSALDSVVITHAHLDHCGYLPRLHRGGFQGPVHTTYDTGRLMSVVLPDSGRLQEEEAAFANRAGYSKHRPALPLYSEQDAWDALDLLKPSAFGTPIDVGASVTARFQIAGHILGSASVHLQIGDITVVVSGDLGRGNHPLLQAPAPIGEADWIVIESTYGDRRHGHDDHAEELADVIDRTVARGGIVIIPAFAVDRTEVLLYHLHRLAAQGRLPDVPVYVDSPMALAALEIYRSAISEGATDLHDRITANSDPFQIPGLDEVHDTEGSKRISRRTQPAIVIAGSGMATGGRVIHHLARFLPDPRNTVALVGFQAAGTRGRSLLDGAQTLKVRGQYVPVRAEIADLSGFSVHADSDELLDWLTTATRPPHAVFIVHGEPEASSALRRRIQTEIGWTAVVPSHRERLSLATP